MKFVFLLPVVLLPAAVQAQAASGMTDHSGMHMQPNPASTTLLTGPMGSRAVSGTATISGQTVTIALRGDRAGSVRSWIIGRGSCAQSTGVVGERSMYKPVSIDAAGNGSASVSLSSPLPQNEAIHVALFESSSDATPSTIACGYLVKGQMEPAMDHSNMDMSGGSMAGMDHSKMDMSGGSMAGMDHSKMDMSGGSMAGMDHSKMDMSGGSMAGMDHSKMDMSGGSMAGMDHSKMDMSAGSMAGMDHSKMDMSGDELSKLRAVHNRMMADPVIRERVSSDPVLQKLVKQLSAVEMGKAPASGAAVSRKPAAAKTKTKSTNGVGAKPAAPKEKAKKAPTPMSGMDHSKMPGMRKPPA